MTKKAQLQQELLEKVKPGTKPSHLKRSKSESDIPKTPPLPLNASFTDPNQALSTLTEELKKTTDLNALLTDQLKEKQQQIEDLRKQLETQSAVESDNSLFARHKSLKDWFTQYAKNKALDTELTENIDEAAEELVQQDKKISHLQNQIIKLKQTNQSLQKDLNLSQRLAELRKNPLPENNSNHSNLLVYAFLALWFITLLNSA